MYSDAAIYIILWIHNTLEGIILRAGRQNSAAVRKMRRANNHRNESGQSSKGLLEGGQIGGLYESPEIRLLVIGRRPMGTTPADNE